MNGWMSSAAATSWTLTPASLLNFTAVALNRSPYFSTFRGPAFGTAHLRAVSPGCQLYRGRFGVAVDRVVRRHSLTPVSGREDPTRRLLLHPELLKPHYYRGATAGIRTILPRPVCRCTRG